MPLLTSEILMLGLLPLLLAGIAFFSCTETALFSLTRHQRRKVTRGNDLVTAALRTLLNEQTRALLLTILMGSMVVSVLYFVISTVLLLEWEERGHVNPAVFAAASVGPLLLMVFLSEILPKLLAASAPEVWARAGAVPLLLLHRGLWPIRTTVTLLVVGPLARLIAPRSRPAELSPDELEALLQLSQQRGLIDPGEEALLQQVLALGQTKVRAIMTPRVDLTAFNLAEPPERLYELIARSRLRRFPVYHKTIDNVVGVVYSRQFLLRQPRTQAELQPLIRSVFYVPELQRGDELLRHFRRTGTTLAIAVDEYGGTAGLVSIEDVAEAIVGPIAGSYESTDTPDVQMIALGVWRVGASLSVRDWAQSFGHRGQIDAGVSTVGGLVMARLGRLPRVGDHVRVGNLLIEVERMAGRRIHSILLRLATPAPAPAPGTEGSAP
ncbi:MAG: hemolysin family protein [Planctomycetota bacterium]|nr:hemolysin family protein [Planctomycetota bacterium]